MTSILKRLLPQRWTAALRRHNLYRAASLTLLVCFAGCSSTQSVIRDPIRIVRDPGAVIGRPKIETQVVRILSLWEPANGRDPDDKPARGFAGQVLFFGPSSTGGCRIHGRVIIYEYANYDPESLEEPVPLHSFTFEPDAWELHRTEGTLGHSYNCFIPFMSSSRDQVNCALRVEYEGPDGHRVRSEMVEVLLPSRTAATKAAALTRGFVRESMIGGRLVSQQATGSGTDSSDPLKRGPVQTASSSAATAGSSATGEPRKLDSVTIPLPQRR